MSEPTKGEIADVLDAAAEVIERLGWWDGGQSDCDSRARCMVTALGAAKIGVEVDVWMAAWEVAEHFVGMPMEDFNDAPGRTKYEVIDTLRRASKELRNEAAPCS